MRLLRRLLLISKPRKRLLLEAAWSLLLARLKLRCFSFSRLATTFSLPTKCPELTGSPRGLVCSEVGSAVERMAGLLPGRTACFPRAIATQAMLRRRGVSTTLYYGARDDGSLVAHVWIQDGDVGVIGMPSEGDYSVVATYQYQV